ncbi:unnamed protein product, partial [Mesorhabditis spiculigera]
MEECRTTQPRPVNDDLPVENCLPSFGYLLVRTVTYDRAQNGHLNLVEVCRVGDGVMTVEEGEWIWIAYTKELPYVYRMTDSPHFIIRETAILAKHPKPAQ